MLEVQRLGKFEILSELGRGAFATVFRARDTVLGREVALKVLHAPLLADPGFVRRFENDARAAAQLDHPHIVAIHDLGQAEGRLYIVMPLLHGGNLADRLARDGRLSFSEAVRIVAEIADALEHAHGKGFIHRDVKPTNILFNARGEAVLADFGLVAAAENSIVAQSSAGGVVGTPAYIPPELWEGKPASEQSDVYALACVCYEMLTGEVLFKGDTSPAVMRAHFLPPQFPMTWPEGVPTEIRDLLAHALSQEPAHRHTTPEDFITELQNLAVQAADPLIKPYTALQTALSTEDWPKALRLAAEVQEHDPDYRDVASLAQQATKAQATAERHMYTAQGKTQALAAAQNKESQTANIVTRECAEAATEDPEIIKSSQPSPDHSVATIQGIGRSRSTVGENHSTEGALELRQRTVRGRARKSELPKNLRKDEKRRFRISEIADITSLGVLMGLLLAPMLYSVFANSVFAKGPIPAEFGDLHPAYASYYIAGIMSQYPYEPDTVLNLLDVEKWEKTRLLGALGNTLENCASNECVAQATRLSVLVSRLPDSSFSTTLTDKTLTRGILYLSMVVLVMVLWVIFRLVLSRYMYRRM